VSGLRFSLPWPPSLNHAYPTATARAGKTKRVKSKALLAYREQCGKLVLADAIPRFTFHNGQRLAVWIYCRPPRLQAFDLDNRLKAVLDVLQYCGVIENDAQVDELHVERGSPDPSGGHIMVQVTDRHQPEEVESDPARIVHFGP
jgi:Holliday junction resolvase RusA-like endonuclease